MQNNARFSQEIEVSGHIIDSMVLPRILDVLMDVGAEFSIDELRVGRGKTDPSYARIEIIASSPEMLERALASVQMVGAVPLHTSDVTCEPAPADGVFPEGFYSTTNLETQVRWRGQWLPVAHPEMDCGIVIEDGVASCIPLNDVKKGQMIVVGRNGVRLVPLERSRAPSAIFHFMGSEVSSEKPRALIIRETAARLREVKGEGGRVLVVAGPALVHVGARRDLSRLIQGGYVDCLFAGNGLATHDIESALFGTSLGVPINGGPVPEWGHEHHLRTINRIRALGGIRNAVEAGILREGIMYSCVKHGVDYVLAGSIRDDGPLPDTVTDVMQAQALMREKIHQGVAVALMLSTMLHSIAVGNLLPASVYTVCVDINPGTLTKLVDRGSLQTVGVVMDVGGFVHELAEALRLPPVQW